MIPARARTALRIGVSAVVVAALFAFVPIRTLGAALAQVSPLTWVVAMATFVACHLAAAAKWRMLIVPGGLPFRSAIRAHFAGLVGNFCLPGSVGGDVVRAGFAMRASSRPAAVALASVVDRAIDTLALLAIAAAGVVWASVKSPSVNVVLAATAIVAGLGAVVAAALWWILKRGKWGRYISQVIDSLDVLVRRPGRLAAALAISVLIQSVLVLVNAYLGRAVGVECSISAWFVAFPAAKLASVVPVSAAGIGVREAALIAFLSPFGTSASRVMAAGLLWQAVLLASSLMGWVVLRLAPPSSLAAPEPVPAL